MRISFQEHYKAAIRDCDTLYIRWLFTPGHEKASSQPCHEKKKFKY